MNSDSTTIVRHSEKVPHRCLIRLRGIYHSLKTAERKAADYLLASPANVQGSGVVEFAERAGCSEATVVRLAQRLGYDGYPSLRNDFGSPEAEVPYRDISADDKPDTVLSKVFENSVQALQDTLASLDRAQYRMSVDALLSARSLAFFGLGNAAVVAREAYHKFLRIGVPCHTSEDADLQLIILSNHLSRGDLMIAISYSGESKPILTSMRAAQARGIRVLAITNFPRSSLAKSADLVLLTAVFHEHINGEIGSERLAQLAVLESLYVNYLLRSGPAIRKALGAANEVVGLNKNRQIDMLLS
ncbi:MAG TPA: MurR/RpiR family transcriptional regulator [Verrucomicrobiae bacterium]|nr:MurR/RpiR family transcriptional regulator [Verrucomicrobiae bacterium]